MLTTSIQKLSLQADRKNAMFAGRKKLTTQSITLCHEFYRMLKPGSAVFCKDSIYLQMQSTTSDRMIGCAFLEMPATILLMRRAAITACNVSQVTEKISSE
jgi:hypothetical protein